MLEWMLRRRCVRRGNNVTPPVYLDTVVELTRCSRLSKDQPCKASNSQLPLPWSLLLLLLPCSLGPESHFVEEAGLELTV